MDGVDVALEVHHWRHRPAAAHVDPALHLLEAMEGILRDQSGEFAPQRRQRQATSGSISDHWWHHPFGVNLHVDRPQEASG